MEYEKACMFTRGHLTLLVLLEYGNNNTENSAVKQKQCSKKKMHLLYWDCEKNSAGFRSCSTGLMQTYLHGFTGDCKSSGVIIVIK